MSDVVLSNQSNILIYLIRYGDELRMQNFKVCPMSPKVSPVYLVAEECLTKRMSFREHIVFCKGGIVQTLKDGCWSRCCFI